MKKLYFSLLALALATAVFGQTLKTGVRPLFDKNSVGEIKLTLPAKNWVAALDSMRLYGMGMLVGNAVIDGSTFNNVGVRFRGDKSYQLGMKRNPFSIKLNHVDSAANHQGHAHIKLSSSLRDPSLVREMLFLDVANHYITTPLASYTKLYINGEYVGIFVNVESVDRTFATRNFQVATPTVFRPGVDYPAGKPDPSCKQNIFGSLEYEENIGCYSHNFEMYGDPNEWTALQELTRQLNGDLRQLENTLDIDNTLWFLALNNVMVNLSSYIGKSSLNYYLFKDNNGRFQIIPWDLNLAFGSFKNTGSGSDLELKELQELDPALQADNPYKPLVSQLLKDPFYRKVYLAHIRQINDDYFASGAYEKRAVEFQTLITSAFEQDKNQLYSIEDFKANLKTTVGKKSRIPGISELMIKRSRSLKMHPDLAALPSVITDMPAQGRGKYEQTRLNKFRLSAKADRFPKRMLMYYRFDNAQPFRSIPMSEEPSNETSGIEYFTVEVEAPTQDAVLYYYFVAENPGAVTFHPANYTQKPLMVKLEDLNK